MITILLKVFTDFWQTKGTTFLLILASALSVWGISSVLLSYYMAERDFKVNFEVTNPADVTIIVDDFRPGVVKAIALHKRVVEMERREVLNAQVKNVSNQWMPIRIFAAPATQPRTLDVFAIIEQSNSVSNEVLIERSALPFIQPQKELQIKFNSGEESTWPLGGVSHDARLAPARMEQMVFAHVLDIDWVEKYLPQKQRRYLVKFDDTAQPSEVKALSEELVSLGRKFGCKVMVSSIRTRGVHVHQNIVDGIALLQKIMGGTIALMGIVLISLMVLTWMSPRTKEISILKAIGAKPRKVLMAYVTATLLITTVGLVLGFWLGNKTAISYNTLVANIQNFMVINGLPSPKVVILILAICLLVPLVSVFLPIRQVINTSVREGTKNVFSPQLRHMINWVSNMHASVKIRYLTNHILRKLIRILFLMALLTVGVGMLLTSLHLNESVRREMLAFSNASHYQLRLKLKDKAPLSDFTYLRSLAMVQEMTPILDQRASYKLPNMRNGVRSLVRTLSTTHRIGQDMLIEGVLDKDCKECLYISGESMRQKFSSISIGEKVELTFANQEKRIYQFSGIFKNLAAIGAPFFTFSYEPDSSMNGIAFRLSSGTSYFDANQAIDDLLLENNIDMVGFIDVDTRLAQLQGHLDPTFLIIRISALLTLLLGLIGLLMVLRLSIHERSREFGVLKAIGASNQSISRMLGMEFTMVGGIASLIGVLIAYPLTGVLCRVIGETVIYHHIPAKFDLKLTIMCLGGLLILIYLFIQLFCWWTFRRSSWKLMRVVG